MTVTANIAIVKDESYIRALLEQTLEDLDGDFEVLTAANGAEGLQLIQREQPQLVFMDVMRLTSLINDVLDLSKLDALRVEWHCQPIKLDWVMEHAIAASCPLVEDKGLW